MIYKKLESWHKNGLISHDQLESIKAYEKKSGKGAYLGQWLSGAAFFAIGLGVLAIIGANWDDIPGALKLFVHFVLLNIGAAIALYTSAAGTLKRECAVFCFSVFTLTMIALIGQVYQLQGSVTDTLILWMILITPVVFAYSHDLRTGLPWMIAFLTTLYMTMIDYIPQLPSKEWQKVMVVMITVFLPLSFMADGKMKLFQNWRPHYAYMFLNVGILLLAISATALSFVWYERGLVKEFDLGSLRGAYSVIFISAILLTAAHYVYMLKRRPAETVREGYMLIIGCLCVMYLPFLNIIPANDLMAYLSFIAIWLLFGVYGQSTHKVWLVRLAVTFITLRIFSIYIELFGTLMDTGIALIVGGGIALMLIWAAQRVNKKLTKLRSSIHEA